MRNLIKTYQEKDSAFECGFHSFLQSRSPFNISFFIYALVYLLLDLEILLVFPFAVSEYTNDVYGLITVLIFILIITIGFVYELGRGALKIESKQNSNSNIPKYTSTIALIGKKKLKDSSISYIKGQ
jgi:NADH-ubiquinone oxidoreductase chain 3